MMVVTVQTTEHDGVLVASVGGEIDMANAKRSARRWSPVCRGRHVGKRLRIVCADGSTVRRVLDLTQLPVPLDGTLEDALSLIRNHAAPRRS